MTTRLRGLYSFLLLALLVLLLTMLFLMIAPRKAYASSGYIDVIRPAEASGCVAANRCCT